MSLCPQVPSMLCTAWVWPPTRGAAVPVCTCACLPAQRAHLTSGVDTSPCTLQCLLQPLASREEKTPSNTGVVPSHLLPRASCDCPGCAPQAWFWCILFDERGLSFTTNSIRWNIFVGGIRHPCRSHDLGDPVFLVPESVLL